jgi:hypothetical protein
VATPIPVIDDDIFSHESVRDARAVDDRVRELAPVVRLGREDIVVMGRFDHVSASLADWRSFSSRSRPWHDPSSVRPEILLTDDPPRHTEVRLVIANALSPKALNHMAEAFARDAAHVVERALESGRRDRRRLGDLPAVRLQGAAGSARPAGAGARTHGSVRPHGVGDDGADEPAVPRGDDRQRAGARVGGGVLQAREPAPGWPGMAMFHAADRGEITPAEAKLLVGFSSRRRPTPP